MRGLLLAALGGCGPPCLNLADAPIDASATDDPAAWRDTLRETLLDFDRWTGRGACVSEVVVEAEGLAGGGLVDHLGAYDRLTARVLLDGRLGPEAARPVLRHELCHAWDVEHGRPSADLPRAFPPADLPAGLRPRGYGTDALASAELLALACEDGPLPPALLEALDAAGCASGLTLGERWVQDHVYVAADPLWAPIEGVTPLSVERRAVPGVAPNRVWDAAFSGDALWVVTLEHAPPQWALWRVPLGGGPVAQHRPLPPTDPLPRPHLIPSPEAGLLVASWGGAPLAWELSHSPEPWFEGGFPDDERAEALRQGDQTLAFEGGRVVAYAPGGEAELWAALPAELAGLADRTLLADGAGLGFTGSLDGWPVAGRWTADGAAAWWPAPTAARMAALPDGRRVGATSHAALDLVGRTDPAAAVVPTGDLLVVGDGAGGWTLGTCSAALDPGGPPLRRARAAHAWGERVWLLAGDTAQLELVSIAAD